MLSKIRYSQNSLLSHDMVSTIEKTLDNFSNENQLTQIKTVRRYHCQLMKRVRHAQINFFQLSTYIQMVFWSKASIYICINILKILLNRSTHWLKYNTVWKVKMKLIHSSVKSMCARIEWNLSSFPLRMSPLSVCWWKSPGVFNNYSSSPNGLWVNSPGRRRANGLLTQRR